MRESERKAPFIAYVDPDKERAIRRAEQVSGLWNVPVIGLSIEDFKRHIDEGGKIRKALVNHLVYDGIRRMPRGRKIDIIPIEIRYTARTIRALGKIKASSILVLLPYHAISSARFIVEQLHKWVKCKDVNISWMQVDKAGDFRRLLKNSRYDRILVSPGAQEKVPDELHSNSRILLLRMALDPEALEIARIRAGVIV
jgi:hypothetical protein